MNSRDPDVARFLESVLWHGLVESFLPLRASESLGLWVMDGAMLQPVFCLRLRRAQRCRISEGPIGRCFRTGETLLCGSAAAHGSDDNISALCGANNVESFILVPMGIGRIRIGVLGVFARRPGRDMSERARSLEARAQELALYLVLCEAVLSTSGQTAGKGDDTVGHPPCPHLAPKGIQPGTLSRVYDYILSLTEPVGAECAATQLGLSGVTARKYLEHLAHTNLLDAVTSYGRPGRPLKRYAVRSNGSDEVEEPEQDEGSPS